MDPRTCIYLLDCAPLYVKDTLLVYQNRLPLSLQKKLAGKSRGVVRRAGWLLAAAFATKQARIACIQYGENGKPRVPSAKAFNISHSATLVAVAVTETCVGVDIETKRIRDPEGIGQALLQRGIVKRQDPMTDPVFISKCWSAYEAYVKYRGCAALSKETLPFPYRYERGSWVSQQAPRIYQRSYRDAVVSVCAESAPQYRILSLQEVQDALRRSR